MRWHLCWISQDKQSSIGMGYFSSEDAALAAFEPSRLELLAQCGEDFQASEIEAGSWSVEGAYPHFGETPSLPKSFPFAYEREM